MQGRARASLTSERRRNKLSGGFTPGYWYSELGVRLTASMSDKEFEDASRVEELAKPKPANSVRLPVHGHWSDFGFGALALSPPYKTVVVFFSMSSLALSF